MSDGPKSPDKTPMSKENSSLWVSKKGDKIGVPKEIIGAIRKIYSPVRHIVQEEKGRLIDKTDIKTLRRTAFKTGQLLEEARRESNTDYLTKIPNRKAFMERLYEEANIIKRKRQEENRSGVKKPRTNVVVVLIDVNRFKQINDTKGHDVGDLFLIKIAKLFDNNRRPGEMIARIGGDEFGTLLKIEEKDGITYEDEVKGYYERMTIIFQENGINISVGTCLVDPEDIEWTLKKADEAMYRAKEKSKQNNDESFLDISAERQNS